MAGKECSNCGEKDGRVCENCYLHDRWKPEEPAFKPEYFSGLNWREAEHLIMRKVDASINGYDTWRSNILLLGLNEDPHIYSKFKTEYGNFQYIRTTPQTYAHPTVNIGGVELPRPEVETPERGTEYWVWTPKGVLHHTWWDARADKEYFLFGMIHLTESRAQAWADYWENVVIAAVRGGD